MEEMETRNGEEGGRKWMRDGGRMETKVEIEEEVEREENKRDRERDQ